MFSFKFTSLNIISNLLDSILKTLTFHRFSYRLTIGIMRYDRRIVEIELNCVKWEV